MKPLTAITSVKAAVRLCAGVAVLCLSGCSSTPQALPLPQTPPLPQELPAPQELPQPQVAAVQQIGAYMLVSIQVPERPIQRFRAVWRRVQELGGGNWQEVLEVKNPFGGTEVRLTILPQGATLEYGGKILRTEGGDLMLNAFGMSVPLNALHHWMLATAAPGEATVAKSKDGSVRSIHQFGWTMEYAAYDDAQRPTTFTLHSAELNAQVEVRIRRWL